MKCNVNAKAAKSNPLIKLNRKVSISTFLKKYEDYEGKIELDDGKVRLMGGASPLHEWLIVEMGSQFRNYLRGNPCQPYGSNLYLKTGDFIIREPDITIICDHYKFNGRVYEGAPKLIVEVVSPSSKFIDLYQKKGEYYQLGVQEYWIVLSKEEVQVNIWNEDRYIEKTFRESKDGMLKVPIQLEGWDLVVEIDSNRMPEGITKIE